MADISALRRNFFVITGGPGAGKTTLLAHLRESGAATAPEAGRAIIRAQTAIGGPARPDINPALYAELMLSWDIRSYEEASTRSGPVFFDRGVPDTLGYLKLIGLPVPPHIHRAAERFRSAETVFMLPPWPEIYVSDSERKQSLDEAEQTFKALHETYVQLGYRPVVVPRAPVKARRDFVMSVIGAKLRQK